MSHFTTILAQNSKGVINTLSSLRNTYKNHAMLFALSSNAPDLSELVNHLTTFSSCSVGCLSAPTQEDDTISCSLAFFDRQYATPFRSSIPGRAPIQVGRWHSFKKPTVTQEINFDENVDWENVWSKSVGNHALPKELQNIKPNTVVYFSDDAPEGLTNSLQALPDANKLGLIASSTPFVTGRPFTLFSNDKIYSSGAVGIALTNEASRLQLDFPAGLKPITPLLKVTRSDGNLVHELDNLNATRTLLGAIEKAHISNAKDDDFYLVVVNNDVQSEVYHITSGDPSRGTISLESHAAPARDVQVQLCHLARNAISKTPPAHAPSLQFQALSPEMRVSAGLIPDVFTAGSENGLLVGRAGELPWKSTVGSASLGWRH